MPSLLILIPLSSFILFQSHFIPSPDLCSLSSTLPPHRAELGRCCNASAWLAVTQDNTPLGSEIVYDAYPSKRLKVSSGLLEILPEVEVLFDEEHNSQSARFSLIHPEVYQVGGFGVSLYCNSVIMSEFLHASFIEIPLSRVSLQNLCCSGKWRNPQEQ